LLNESLAIDHGNPATPGGGGTACAATDQRGASRVGTCDIGSYEYGSVLPDATVTTNIHDASHTLVTSIAVGTAVHDYVTLSGGGPVPGGTATISWFTNNTCAGSAAKVSSPLTLVGGAIDATSFAQTPSSAG